MAIWKEQTTPAKEPVPMSPTPAPQKDDTSFATTPSSSYNTQSTARPSAGEKETLIAANLAIEGKIQGSGHVRVAGQFKGDVNVDGNLTIDQGAKVIGGVRASTVTIAGELEGNVDAAVRVELLASGVLNGDVKAGSLTVAAGSRMRGNAEFGWDEGKPGSTANRPKVETGTAA
jgi:cytoskeletal protein CcmA (bactofilin family)